MATTTLPALRGAPPSSSLPIKKVQTLAPNQTLYITNLPSSKVQKQDLRLYLYTLFTTYGPVLDIVALKTMKMRGQAHVTFRDLNAATQAMRALQGMEFLGHELNIQYAKSKSDMISRLDGTFAKPKESAGIGASTELQKSIFDGPLAAATTPVINIPVKDSSNDVVEAADSKDAAEITTDDGRDVGVNPGVGSVIGQKRRREEDDDDDDVADEDRNGEAVDEDEDSGSDVAMEEDSDDD